MAGLSFFEERDRKRRLADLVETVDCLTSFCNLCRLPEELRPQYAKPTDLNMHFGGREALKLSAVKFVRSFDAESLRRTNTAGRDAAYADSTAMHMVDLALVDFILDRRAPHIAIAAGILMLRNAGWRASSEQEEADWELKCRRLLDTVTEKVSPSKLIGQVTLEHLRHDPKLCGGAYTGVRDWTNRPWGSWHLH